MLFTYSRHNTLHSQRPFQHKCIRNKQLGSNHDRSWQPAGSYSLGKIYKPHYCNRSAFGLGCIHYGLGISNRFKKMKLRTRYPTFTLVRWLEATNWGAYAGVLENPLWYLVALTLIWAANSQVKLLSCNHGRIFIDPSAVMSSSHYTSCSVLFIKNQIILNSSDTVLITKIRLQTNTSITE